MANKDYKAVIVEGEAREPLIIDNIAKIFFKQNKVQTFTLPAGQNIYMLWKKLKEDEFETDILEVLRENSVEMQQQLSGMNRNDFSEMYLFFDYDGHNDNLGMDDDEAVLGQMLESVDNETENGKLYISYPMVEALRDFEAAKCDILEGCFILLDKFADYKRLSAERAKYPQFKQYDFEIWKEVIDVFAMRISCLMNRDEINAEVYSYKEYMEKVSPREIFKKQTFALQRNQVFILSAFPEFLLDYFGEKLWKRCVKHRKNQKGNRVSKYIY